MQSLRRRTTSDREQDLAEARVEVTVLAAKSWKTSADLIADVAKLGYLNGNILDPTYGKAFHDRGYRFVREEPSSMKGYIGAVSFKERAVVLVFARAEHPPPKNEQMM